MRGNSAFRIAGLVLAGVVVGSVIGPPIAQAVGASLVTIEGSGSTNKAKVSSKGQLAVDTGAQIQSVLCGPNNQQCKSLDVNIQGGHLGISGDGNASVIDQGTASHSDTQACGTIESVTVDNSTASSSTVSMTIKDQSNNTVNLWQGTVAAGGHVNDTFGLSGIGFQEPLTVTETGGAAQWYVYGNNFCQGP